MVELLTVVAIVGVLAGILIPVVGRARQSAMSNRCASNQRQIYAAMMLWGADNKSVYMPAVGSVVKTGSFWWWYGSGYSSGLQANGLSPLAGYLGLPMDVQVDGQRALNTVTICPLNQQDTRIAGNVSGAYGYPYVINYWVMAHPTTPSNMPHQPVKIASLPNPSSIILLSDGPADVTVWGVGFQSQSNFASRVAESHGGRSNILWADGHVTLSAKADIDVGRNIQP